jgi:hypothetical protein
MGIEKLKGHKVAAFHPITADFIKAGRRKFRSKIHKLIKTVSKKKDLPEEGKESIFVPIFQKGDERDCINYREYQFANCVQSSIQHPAVKSNSICRENYWGSSMWNSTQQVNY